MITVSLDGGFAASSAPELGATRPLTEGIPQQVTDPLQSTHSNWDDAASGFVKAANLQWDEEHKARVEEARKKRFEYLEKLDDAVLNPDQFFKKHPLPANPFGGDPDQDKRGFLVHGYLRLATGKRELSADMAEMYRAKIAGQRFGGKGADDDAAFLAEITREAQGRKAAQETARSLASAATDDASLPVGEGKGFAGWLETAKALPGFDPANVPDYAEKFEEERSRVAAEIAPIAEVVRDTWRAFRTDTPAGIPSDKLAALSDEDFTKFLGVMRTRANLLPDAEREKFLAGMRKDLSRAVEGFWRQAGSAVVDLGTAVPSMAFEPGDIAQAGVSPEARGQFERARNRSAEVRRILSEEYDPIDYVKGWGWVQKIPGVTVTSMTMAVPVVGQGVMAASMQGAAQESLYLKFRDEGLSEADAGQYSAAIAPAVTIPQMALEKLSFGIISQKHPWMRGVVQKVGDQITNRAGRFLAKTAAITAAEGTIEVTQDFTESAVRDLAAALNAEIPGVDLAEEFKGAWAQFPEIAGSMLVLSMFGAAGGLSQEARAAAWAESTPRQMKALGIQQADIEAIEAAKGQGPASLTAAVDGAWQRRQADSPEAATAAAEEAAEAREQAAAVESAKASGYLPDIVQRRAADGSMSYEVLDGDTKASVGTATDLGGAMRIAQTHSAALDEKRAHVVAYVASALESGEAALAMNEDGTGENRFELDTLMTEALAAAEDPASIDQFAAQAALKEKINGGSGEVTRVALGQHKSEVRAGVRHMTNRLFRGGSVLTVFHEMWHGMTRRATAAGVISRNEKIQFIRTLQSGIGEGTLKRGALRGESIAFLPTDFDTLDTAMQDKAIDEAMSEIAEMEVLRTRKRKKDGKVIPIGSGIIARNLNALMRLAPGATKKFRALIEAARGVMGLASARALAMKKAIREGRINESEYEAFMDKIAGRDLQSEHDGTVRDEHAAIVGQEAFQATDDAPFSLVPLGPGPRRITEAPEVVSLSSPFDAGISEPSALRRDFWSRFDEITASWPKTIETDEGPIAWSKSKTGDKLRSFKDGEPALLHFIAAANLPALLVNSKLAAVEPEGKGDRTVQEVHRRYAWANFPNGERRHVLLTVERPSIHADKARQNSDQAYSSEVLGVSIEVIDEKESANVVNLKPGEDSTSSSRQAVTSAQEKLTRFQSGIKPEHRWVESSPFSLAPAAFVESLQVNAVSRIKDPRVKAAIFTRMLDKLGALKRDRDELGIAFGKGYKRRAIEDPRTTASIRKEAAMREALRRVELEDEAHARHHGILHGDDLSQLWNQPTWAAIATPGDRLHGRIMSFSTWRRRNPGDNYGGEYDGSTDVPRVAFGGNNSPDQIAQELYDNGQLPAPTPDALWTALIGEAKQAGKYKEMMAAAREDLRKARQQAAEETRAWMNDRLNEEAANYSPRQRLLRALAMLDGILSVLPPEVRGRIGGYTQLAKLASDEARLKFLNERVAKAETVLDAWIKDDHRKQLADLIEKSKPKKNKPGEAKKGKIGVDAHRIFTWAERYRSLDETQVDAERIAIENERQRIADESVPGIVHPDLLELSNRERALDLVGDFENKTPADQAAALDWLRNTYTFGRDEWQAKESERLAEVARLQRVVIEELARQKGVTLPSLEIPKFDNRTINGMTPEEAEPILRDHDTRVRNVLAKHKAALRKALEEGGVGSLAARQAKEAEEQNKEVRTMLEAGTGEFISFVQTLERMLGPGHPLVARWNAAIGEAQMAKTEAMLAADAAWLKAASEALGNPGKLKVQERLWEMSAVQSVTIEKQIREPGSELEVRLSNVTGLLDGTLDPAGHGMTADDLPALQEAWDAHQARTDKGKERTEFLTFKTVGERTTQVVKLTPMQAITLVLTGRMARYAKNLEIHGFTPEVIQSAAEQIGPEGMAMLEWLADYYEKNYEPLAAVFREMFGVDLPKEANYSPFRAERGGVDKDIGGPQEAGMVPEGGFRANMLKTRAPSHQLAPQLVGAISVFQGHVAVSEHWRHFAPLVREMKAVLGGLETRQAIEAVHGRALVRALDGWLLAFEQNGLKQRKMSDGVDKLIRGMQGNIAILGLAFRVSTIVKNYLLPAFGSARRIGILPWLRGLARVAAGKVSYQRFRQSRVVKLRERAGFSPELKLATAKMLSARPSNRRNAVIWAMEKIAIADARSTAVSAAISWDFHYRENAANGMAADEAAALAEMQMQDDVRRTAQPLELAERSLYELSSSEAGRLLFLFATDARKETAIFAEAMRRAWKQNGAKGLLTSEEFRTAATAIWLTTGLLNTVISRALMDSMDGGDDDEWFDEKNWSPTAVLASTLLGPVGGIPLLRDLVSGFSQGEMTKPLRGLQAAVNLLEAAWEGDIPDKDRALWVERQINKIMVGAGLFHRGAAEMGAFSNIIDQAARMLDNATSD